MSPDLFREIATLTGEHLMLVFSAVVVAVAIAVPGGVLLTRQTGVSGTGAPAAARRRSAATGSTGPF